MTLEGALIEWIAADDVVTQLAGSRIYPMLAPSTAALPFVVYTRTGTERERCQSGRSNLVTASLQFDCWALTRETAWELSKALGDRCENYTTTGPVPGAVVHDVTIRRIIADNDRDIISEPLEGQDDGPRGVSVDVVVKFKES